MDIQEFDRRSRELLHAMQSGVEYESQYDSKSLTGKHLRVGVNNALVEGSALARLLIRKGVITEGEYFDVIIEGLEGEVRSYEQRLKKLMGATITLG